MSQSCGVESIVLMASEHTKDAWPASSSDAISHTKSRRRRGKREHAPGGVPKLQFVTATNLAQFRDQSARKSVRSQAMIYVRNSPAEGNQKLSNDSSGSSTRSSTIVDGSVEHACDLSLQEVEMATSAMFRYYEAAHCASVPAGPISSGRVYDHLLSFASSSKESNPRVVDYEDSDCHEAIVLRMLAGKLATVHQIGDGVDPFNVIPQYDNPELSSIDLQRSCIRAFASNETMKKWVPGLMAHSHIILSSPILASTWLDMNAGCSGDSKRTTLLKGEIMAMLNERLRNPEALLDETTLLIILHLLGGEIWSCDETVLRIHQNGVAIFIAQLGGMSSLSSRAVAEVATACCYHCDIFCETQPMSLFHHWEPSNMALDGDSDCLPESPLFCPANDFTTLKMDTQCKPHTYDLLKRMYELTDIFIGQDHLESNGVSNIPLESPDVERFQKMAEISQELAALPCAYIQGLSTSNDWVYEACRIAALIYTTAILLRVPFSVAVDSEHPLIASNTMDAMQSNANRSAPATRLTATLYAVLRRTDVADVWRNMSGVLYWVTAVGAAAARTSANMDMTLRPRFRDEEEAIWVRRCLALFSTRTMIVLIFRHPTPILLAQKRLLKVQGLIGTG